jgi:hypothetical protein
MNDLRLKNKFASTIPGSRLSSGSLESLTKSQQQLAYLSDFQTVSSATPILLLEKITGTVLSGIGVFTLIANSLLCGSLLFQGPSLVEFLIDLTF